MGIFSKVEEGEGGTYARGFESVRVQWERASGRLVSETTWGVVLAWAERLPESELCQKRSEDLKESTDLSRSGMLQLLWVGALSSIQTWREFNLVVGVNSGLAFRSRSCDLLRDLLLLGQRTSRPTANPIEFTSFGRWWRRSSWRVRNRRSGLRHVVGDREGRKSAALR